MDMDGPVILRHINALSVRIVRAKLGVKSGEPGRGDVRILHIGHLSRRGIQPAQASTARIATITQPS